MRSNSAERRRRENKIQKKIGRKLSRTSAQGTVDRYRVAHCDVPNSEKELSVQHCCASLLCSFSSLLRVPHIGRTFLEVIAPAIVIVRRRVWKWEPSLENESWWSQASELLVSGF